MLKQTQQQKLLQKLSPQQIQLMKLLQVPTVNLEERIKEELEENPALEYGEESNDDEFKEQEEYEVPSDDEEFEPDGSENEYDNIDISEYVSEGDDDVADYKLRDDNYPDPDESNKTIPIRVETSFHEHLLSQLGMLELNNHQNAIAEHIIGSIDDDGYLRREISSMVDDLSFSQNIDTTEEEIRELIKKIQDFDPAGVCCTDLKECLLLQLKRKSQDDFGVHTAYLILENYFDEFTKKHYEKIQKALSLSDEGLKEAITQIIRLNPKPGGNYATLNKAESYVLPDFFILNNAGKLELTLNSRNAPDLRISGGYREMLKEYDRGDKKDKRQKEAVLFIKQKIDAAKWFIDAIKQRQHTLLSTMESIMDYQREFFLTGDETTMKPMILKDIADRTQLDISTVSRVANSKYVQTEFGTFKLKFFFSESLSTDSGEEVSTREVKKILSDLIEAENKRKPLSDENLTKMLQDKGYNIARRTVAKYREQLNIPVARLRKEL
ncbi:RNA polymerase factor sigma-54 [Chitinophaga nivalis]|uniref:RNA polymerase factor sigma-54 n=1 Tax=Chitinophaga nivalis TaxID=2991709 RepID=A0ABT3IVJ6_9BACT|nr:RNA polymerase factor sigma-54 [Chitinophaga nivalis]MCW3462322.1 RNA polymerase factor sigma-54 [Chitinophaga nivalis]MCW3487987.1 RNA polymerase factor sigma-54 [Chitinophaga nivalis]